MELGGKAKRVRIYVSEGDLLGHRPAYAAIVDFLRRENASGATVFKAIEGFGAAGDVHTTRLVDIDQALPVVIEWVDTPERAERLLARIKQMVPRGLITVEDTNVALFAPHLNRMLPRFTTAGEVMSRDVATVTRDVAVRQVVELLVGKDYRAVPVVDGGVPVGIVTSTDLVTRGGLPIRLDLLASLEPPELRAELDRLTDTRKTASDVMTGSPVTVSAAATLAEVAAIMCRRRLKRLPVVDDRQALVGIISRLDLLRTVIEGYQGEQRGAGELGLEADARVAGVMRRDVPTVLPDTPLAEVMQAVVATRLNQAVVVDGDRHVVGVVTDAELLERVTPGLRPSALHALAHRLPFVHLHPGQVATEQHALARTARDLMIADVVTVREDAPLREAIAAMIHPPRKLIPVVDADQRLVGVVDRRDVLHGLVAPR